MLAPSFWREIFWLVGLEHRAVADLTVEDKAQPVSEVEQCFVVFFLVETVVPALDVLDQLLKSSILPGPIGNLEEIGIERRQFTGTEVSGDVFASALFVEGVTL